MKFKKRKIIGAFLGALVLFYAAAMYGVDRDGGGPWPGFRWDGNAGPRITRYRIDADSGMVAFYRAGAGTEGASTPATHRIWKDGAADRRRVIELLHRRGADKDLSDFEIVLKHHYGPAYHVEKTAYERVFDLKDHVEAIAGLYEHLSPELLMAVIKEESQGRRCVMSHKAAIGLSQIKYQGAFTFVWNAMFRERVRMNGKMRTDHFNRNIRKRYGTQLKRIETALIDNRILVKRKSDLASRRATWRKLKAYVRGGCGAAGPPVDVEIAALYLDHLIHVFDNLREKALFIKAEVMRRPWPDVRDLRFTGTRETFWRQVQEAAVSAASPEDALRMIIRRLDHFIDMAGNPGAWYAAYHAGPTLILARIFRGDRLPRDSSEYAGRVENYENVFQDLYLSESRLLYSRRTLSPLNSESVAKSM